MIGKSSQNKIKKNKIKKNISWNLYNNTISLTYSATEYDRSNKDDTLIIDKESELLEIIYDQHFNKPLSRNPTHIHNYIVYKE
tara:strand:- start:3917 stop:4165 length:249 start_codon:yes stop_codon:yes gene_type:complete